MYREGGIEVWIGWDGEGGGIIEFAFSDWGEEVGVDGFAV